MMTAWYEKYVAVALTIVALSMIVQLFFSLYLIISNKTKANESTASTNNFQKIMEDLDKLIQRKCFTAYRRVLQPYVSKALKSTPLINDKVVNDITLLLSKEILSEMSDNYKAKLLEIYNEEKLEEIIVELVYNTVTEMALSINKNTIHKNNFITNFNTVNKNDV